MLYRKAALILIIVCVFVLMTGLLLSGLASANLGAQSCAVPGGYATIQAAVIDPECDLVNVGSGTFTENVVISRTMTIQGQGAANSIVNGGGSDIVFYVQPEAEVGRPVTITVTLNDLSIVNGKVGIINAAAGDRTYDIEERGNLYVNINHCAIGGNSRGGILNSPKFVGRTEVQIIDSTISGNQQYGIQNNPGYGGIANLTVVNSVISDNLGPGIVNRNCGRGCPSETTLHMTGSTISGNSGSGIVSGHYTSAYVTNSTISGNTAVKGGGISSSCGYTDLNNSTITGNSAESGGGLYVSAESGGGLYVHRGGPYECSGFVYATHSIVANSKNGGDCILDTDDKPWGAQFHDYGHNIVEDGSCITAPTSSSGDPLLGPLAHNGGATLTHALLLESPAIDAGDTAVCPDTDQRGYPRPIDGDLDGTTGCDIGSFELFHKLDSIHLPIIAHH